MAVLARWFRRRHRHWYEYENIAHASGQEIKNLFRCVRVSTCSWQAVAGRQRDSSPVLDHSEIWRSSSRILFSRGSGSQPALVRMVLSPGPSNAPSWRRVHCLRNDGGIFCSYGDLSEVREEKTCGGISKDASFFTPTVKPTLRLALEPCHVVRIARQRRGQHLQHAFAPELRIPARGKAAPSRKRSPPARKRLSFILRRYRRTSGIFFLAVKFSRLQSR